MYIRHLRGYLSIILCFIFAVSGFNSFHPYAPVETDQTNNVELRDIEYKISEDWEQTYGDIGYDVFTSLVETTDGGFVLTGDTSSYGVSSRDFWVLRVDEDGIPLWNVTFGGTSLDSGYDIIEVSSGGFAICGATRLASVNYFSLIRIDDGGNLLWYENYTSTWEQKAFALQETDDGGYIVVGGSSYLQEFYAIRTDENGTLVWDSYYILGDYAVAEAVLSLGEGNGFMIAGTVENHSSGSGGDDYFLMKLNDTGHLVWDASYGGAGTDYCFDLVEGIDGGYVLFGKTNSFGSGGYDAYIVKVNDTGFFEWSQTYGGASEEGCRAATRMSDDGYAFAGYSSSDDAIGDDIWIVRTNVDGETIWSDLVQVAQDQRAYGIVEVSDGGVAVCGYTNEDAKLVRRSEAQWIQTPTDQDVFFGENFEYDVNATSSLGPVSYNLSDEVNFQIDINGIIQNATILSVGQYELIVIATGINGLPINAKIQISVTWRYSNLLVSERGSDIATDLVETEDGGLVVIGSTRYTFMGDDAPWIYRLDKNGEVVWSEVYTDFYKLRDIITCSTGGYVVTGYHVDGLGYPTEAWLLKIDENGHQVWNSTYDRAYMDYGEELIEAEDGGFYIFGSTQDDTANYDMWLIRTDSEGNHLWNRTYGVYDQNDEGRSIARCPGGYILTGFVTPLYKNTFLLRIDESGNEIWNQTYTNTDLETPASVIPLEEGGFAIAGSIVLSGESQNDMFVRFVNETGHEVNRVTIGGYMDDACYGAVQIHDGSLIAVGLFEQGNSYDDGWMVQFDTSGAVLSNNTFGALGGNEEFYGVTELSAGGVAIAGRATQAEVIGSSGWIVIKPFVKWITEPMDQTIEFGEPISIPLEISSAIGASHYSLSPLDLFEVVSVPYNPTIVNATIIPWSIDYVLTIRAFDYMHNMIEKTITISYIDTTEPIWTVAPSDQQIFEGQSFSLQLEAYDLNVPLTWSVNDTSNFSVSSTGLITSNAILSIGNYGINVSVSDLVGNTLSRTFRLRVLPHPLTTSTSTTTTGIVTTTTPQPIGSNLMLLIIIAASIGGVAVLVIGVMIWKKKSK